MQRSLSPFLFAITLLIFSTVANAQQLSSGIIDPKRAMDWSAAGIPGGVLPSTNWPVCTTLNPGVTGAQITAALSSCHTAHPTGGVVALSAGTFTLPDGIIIPNSFLALRGQGANA